MELANMQVAPEQAQFMQFLLRLIRAKNVLELGTFTGYSALAMSLALPENGRLITCDLSAEWTKNTHFFWQEAKQDHKIQLRLGRALDTLHTLVDEGWEQKFDFIFIDADKTNYINYYEMALKLIQPQGLIAIDNVLWDGKVIDENEVTGQTREIRKLNDLLKNDTRVFTSLLPIADGLFLVQKV
jgi:predicted O-methyltransferase YrrM